MVFVCVHVHLGNEPPFNFAVEVIYTRHYLFSRDRCNTVTIAWPAYYNYSFIDFHAHTHINTQAHMYMYALLPGTQRLNTCMQLSYSREHGHTHCNLWKCRCENCLSSQTPSYPESLRTSECPVSSLVPLWTGNIVLCLCVRVCRCVSCFVAC